MPPQKDYNFAARKRTATLPAKLRTELEQLGHLPPNSNKQRISRKDRRKLARDQPKLNRNNKRKRALDSDDVPAPPPASTSASTAPTPPAPKRAKVALPPPAPQRQTPLERILAKQDGAHGPDPASRKSKAQTDEDREIAWLEAKLGLQRGLSSAEKGKMRGEFDGDGLGELFDTLGDLEGAAFGTTKKNYAKLLASANPADLDLPSDFDPAELDLSSGDDDDEDAEDDDEDEAFGEYGIDDDELVDPSDDDDHAEMGEIGRADSQDEAEAEFDVGDQDDEFDDEFEGIDSGTEDDAADDEPQAGRGGKSVRFADADDVEPGPVSTAVAAPAAGKYVPPHLRKPAAPPPAGAPAPTAEPEAATAPEHALDAPPDDPRLRRQLQGQLNKLSAANMGAIVDALAGLYHSHPRAVVSASLTGLLLQTVADRDNLGEALVVTYAALAAALFRVVGVEFPAGVLARAVEMLDAALAKHAADAPGAAAGGEGGDDGFEGRPGSKEALNLVSFVAELYNFQVVHCGLVYDLVRTFVNTGMGELEVELLSRIVKRSGQQLRSDDPSALKDIITLVKQKMAGVDPASMNSRTRFMVEQLTNLKNNKLKAPGADGAIDHHTPLRKFLTGLNKRRASGAAPEPLRVGLAELRDAGRRGKWWLVGAAWAGDPLAEHAAGGAGAGASRAGAGAGTVSAEARADDELARLARKQGMNTDVRKGVFNVLMSSEDYIDACERLQQLGLSDVQQREIARVLLQCSGNEKEYNPYYTLVGARLCATSHSFQITLQYLLWDFLRSLGEATVGGEEMVKTLADSSASASAGEDVPARKVAHTARFYAWCLAKGALPLTILKPVPFGTTLAATRSFLNQLVLFLILGTQTSSPAFALAPATATAAVQRRDREALERVLVKAAAHARLQTGLAFFVDQNARDVVQLAQKTLRDEPARRIVKWGLRVAAETLTVGGIVEV
ncbi:hypothetical protein JCM3770_005130 [Rhodotorula araucariae]